MFLPLGYFCLWCHQASSFLTLGIDSLTSFTAAQEFRTYTRLEGKVRKCQKKWSRMRRVLYLSVFLQSFHKLPWNPLSQAPFHIQSLKYQLILYLFHLKLCFSQSRASKPSWMCPNYFLPFHSLLSAKLSLCTLPKGLRSTLAYHMEL